MTDTLTAEEIDALVAAATDEIEPSPTLGTVLPRSQLATLVPPSPLIKDVLDYPAAAVLVGSYGVGKTFLALALACCVATGKPWLGNKVERRKVLLVVGEGGSGLDNRITAWEQGFNRGEPVADEDLTVALQPHTISSAKTWETINEICDDTGVGFVVLDTLSSLGPDLDETKDAATVIRRMQNLAARINGTVLLVHHPGWSDSSRTRGGYQFEGNSDNVLVMTGTPDEPLVQLTRKKVKDGEGGQTIWLRRLVQQLTGTHLGRTSVVIGRVEAAEVGVPIMERIKMVLDGLGDIGATGPQLMAELDVPGDQRSTFYRHLGKVVADGRAEQRGTPSQRRYFTAGEG